MTALPGAHPGQKLKSTTDTHHLAKSRDEKARAKQCAEHTSRIPTDLRRLSERRYAVAKRVLPQVFKARFGLPFARKQKVTAPPGAHPGPKPQPTTNAKKPRKETIPRGTIKPNQAVE
ncbi:hypothetical protein [Diaphorobacter aerolatus]|uniref:Uncharacterized protein n=1 Tax=Diaphorobacter aerolatus TaxID=1288495 RepID=A0A7H0GGZ8_9BURK|nr:hypothetical protein [Diaphorobacter aerolatus]QNP47564.1 hypothetical protein H9K75_15135 [Diaphorobacter aerolatus]